MAPNEVKKVTPEAIAAAKEGAELYEKQLLLQMQLTDMKQDYIQLEKERDALKQELKDLKAHNSEKEALNKDALHSPKR